MDPDAALARIRDTRKRFDEAERDGLNTTALILAQELAEAIEDLDDWLSKGGFLPKDWGSRRT